jgi:hypothetical protein
MVIHGGSVVVELKFSPFFSLFLGIMLDKPKFKVILLIVILILLIAHYFYLFIFQFQPLAFGPILFLYKIWSSLFFWLFFISFS